MKKSPPKPGLFTPNKKDEKKQDVKNIIIDAKEKKQDDAEFFTSSLDDILSEVKENLSNQGIKTSTQQPTAQQSKQQVAPEKKEQTQPQPQAKHIQEVKYVTGDDRLLAKLQKKQIIELKSALDIQKRQILDVEAKLAERTELLTKYNEELKKLKDEYLKVVNVNKMLQQSADKIKKDVEQKFITEIKEKDVIIKKFETEKANLVNEIKTEYEKKLTESGKIIEKLDAEKEVEVKKFAGALQTENEKLKQELEESKKTIADVKMAYQRTMEEVNDFKLRSKQTQDESMKYSSMKLVGEMLNALDNLDRIVNVQVEDPKLKDYLLGFKMINESLFEVLRRDGVEIVKTQGVLFDPNVHQAKEKENHPDKEDDEILAVFQKGYTYKGRLVRPAVVKVNKK